MSDIPPKSFYVYCISSKFTNERGLKKLGLTIHPVHRLRQYATGDAPGCGLDKEYDALWKVNVKTDKELREMEKIIHTYFADKRQKGSEWFTLNFENVELFMKQPQKFEVKQLSFDEVKDINTKYKEPISTSEKSAYEEELKLIELQNLNYTNNAVKSMPKQQRYLIKGSNTNIPCIISKPEQGKKTIEAAKIIKDDIKNNPNILSIFFSQSRKNQANNATKNFKENILDELGIEDLPNLHGDKNNSKDPNGFLYRALHKNERLVSALANKSRASVAKDIIKGWLQLNTKNRARIYADEAQKTISIILLHLYSLLDKEEKNRVELILIDAHVKGILENKDFNKEFGLGINKRKNEYDLSNYLFLSSMPINRTTWKTTLDILESYTAGSLEINSDDYILWPLAYKKVDQASDAITIIKTIKNSCLCLINGDGYYIYNDEFPSGKYISKKNCKLRDCQSEACSSCNSSLQDSELMIVTKLREKYSKDKAFILSGHHCIDRAMTYHTAKRPFTKVLAASDLIMIKSWFDKADKRWTDCSTNKQEDISQMIKRACGSFKEQLDENNIPYPIFHMSDDIWNGLLVLEKISTEISKMTGIINQMMYNDVETSINNGKEVNTKPRTLAELKNPNEYYFKVYDCSNKSPKDIQAILTSFREKIGGERVELRTITSRLNPGDSHRDEFDRYIEDVPGKKTHLKLSDLKSDGGHKLLDCGLNEDSISRVRICWDDNILQFAIIWRQDIDVFRFNKSKFKFIEIDGDGNCLFNCFISAKKYGKSLGRLRSDVANYLEDNISSYSEYIKEYNPDTVTSLTDRIRISSEWDSDIMDLLPRVLSDLLKINVFIYKFKTGFDSGGEEVLFDEPIVFPEDHRFEVNIHLKYSNGAHYDLFQPCE